MGLRIFPDRWRGVIQPPSKIATNLAQWKNQSSSSSSSSPPSRWNARKQNGGRTDSLNDTNTRPFHGSTRFWVTLNRELYTPARYADNYYLWVDGKAWVFLFLPLLFYFDILFLAQFRSKVLIRNRKEGKDSFSSTRSLKLKLEFSRLTTFHGIHYEKAIIFRLKIRRKKGKEKTSKIRERNSKWKENFNSTRRVVYELTRSGSTRRSRRGDRPISDNESTNTTIHPPIGIYTSCSKTDKR